ncbi:MAG: RNA polymerase sigma factor [Bacillota bacterium]|jgi:RNA polymerase sigma-70 factor (ECF subfamily)
MKIAVPNRRKNFAESLKKFDLQGEKMIFFLISLVDDPDHQGFLTNLYDEYKEGMFYYAFSILHDENLAEDAVNQAFIGLIKNVEKFFEKSVKKMKPYVVISVRNACYSMLKKSKRRNRLEILSDRVEETLFDKKATDILDSVGMSEVAEAVKSLTEQYRTVILLKYFYEYSYKDIAVEMNISVKHVGVLLNRAKAILKREIMAGREKYEASL